ncbi:nudix hydrolase 10-like isoform X2 [Prosopis cineraria]|uniref:nudix hydrolase 10-like isoform X2 n=1 Tax=Prosopis cineraria TaxID=364024 RepID=UPI00240FCAFB|nr:nudix hydrolase 10-like isoform X2 [Prosopis cineraria]
MLRLLPLRSFLFLRTRNPHYLVKSQHLISLPGPLRREATGVRIKVTTPCPIWHMAGSTSSMSNTQVAAGDELQQVKLLTSTNDNYGGVIVEMDEPMDPTTFISILRASISHWKQLGKKGVWIKLPIDLVNLVEPLVKEGFWYHHAEPKYLMLVYWIPESAHTIPANATHRVGVGAFVMNGKQEGEDICEAAVREVKEETGVDSEFLEVIAFRQSHESFFEKSDLYFVCMMRPLSFDIQIQDVELEAAQWMPFEEYAAQPFVQKHQLLKYINDICWEKINRQYSGFNHVPVSSVFSDKNSYLYLNAGDLKRYISS